jgi:hypothetical protein
MFRWRKILIMIIFWCIRKKLYAFKESNCDIVALHAQGTAKINAGRQGDCGCAVESLLKRV